MMLIFTLTFLVLSAVGRPQNDGTIHTDNIPERRQAGPELTAAMVELLTNGTDRQNDGTDLIPERRQAESRAANSCGCAAVSYSGRIVGGSEVSPKYKYPYQAFLQMNGYNCGGTIINKRYVLTAMHCLYPPNSRRSHPVSKCSVVVGEHDRRRLDEGGQIIGISRFIKRSDYDSVNTVNDIALLELDEDIKFTEKVKPACLPTDTSKTYEGEQAFISGFGGTVGYKPGQGHLIKQKSAYQLQESSVTISESSDPKCKDVTKSDSATRMCAFGEGTDTCQGDSGGPMVVAENGKYTVVGVVSYGRGCASKWPGVYARVTHYLSWINSYTRSGDCTGGSTGGSTCRYTDTDSWCYMYSCSWAADICPKKCKC